MPKVARMSKPTESTTQSTQSTQTNPGPQAASPKAKAPWEIPFAMPMPEVFSQMVRDQIARTQAIMGELAAYEGVAVQRARTAVDDLTRLTSDSIGYVSQLATEWRKLSIETMQRTAEAFAPRA